VWLMPLTRPSSQDLACWQAAPPPAQDDPLADM
jgi:hypothetical protein